MVVPAFFALPLIGHALLKLSAKDGRIDGSTSWVESKLRSRFSKEEQWANPRVWAPAVSRFEDEHHILLSE